MASSRPTAKGKQHEPRSFEEELASLEQAVEDLEGGDLSLEDAIGRYESAFQAWKHCARLLQSAQKRIEILTESHAGDAPEGDRSGGAFSWKPLPLKSLSGAEIAAEDAGPEDDDAFDDSP